MSLSNIYEGWKNHLLPQEDLKEVILFISEKRNNICLECDKHSYNVPEYKSLRPDAHCTECGCTLAAKTKCLSCECPLQKWLAINPKENER